MRYTAQAASSFAFRDGFEDGEATTIRLPLVNDEDNDDSPIYDVYGRMLCSVPAKGIYIKGGRKYVVR